MQFIDLHSQYLSIQESVESRIKKILNHGQYILGPEITELEATLAQRTKTSFCVSTSSGTVSLEIALRALEIGPGDEVITVPFSFFSTAEVIGIVGAKPVFVDIRPDTFCINEDLIEKAITSKTRAIMPVSLYGQMADMKKINAIAEKYHLPVIEDAAQSFGAQQNGISSCGSSTIGCTSFYPAKPLGCYGDGGAIFTNDEELAKRFVLLRNHGSSKRDDHPILGCNGRLDTIQAAVLLAKLEIFDKEIQMRNEVANFYSESLKDICITPYIPEGNLHVYAQYTVRIVRIKERNKVQTELGKQGIPTVTHYSRCIHEQPAFAYLGYKPEDFPVALQTSREILCLPMSPYLKREDQEKIINAIKRI